MKIKIAIIAQPKTASTSLLHAIGEITGMSCDQCFHVSKSSAPVIRLVSRGNWLLKRLNSPIRLYDISTPKLRDSYPAIHYPAMSMLHSDIADLSGAMLANTIFKSEVHKQHLPPTQRNIEIFANICKVIIIRPPLETIYSYRRVPSLGDDMKQSLADNDFCQKLEAELFAWQEGWLSIARQNASTLVISKDDVVNNTADVLRKIVGMIGRTDIEIPQGYSLPRKRVY